MTKVAGRPMLEGKPNIWATCQATSLLLPRVSTPVITYVGR